MLCKIQDDYTSSTVSQDIVSTATVYFDGEEINLDTKFVEHSFRHGFLIAVEHDDCAYWNPRVESDNFGTMMCSHNRYTLGDKGITETDFVCAVSNDKRTPPNWDEEYRDDKNGREYRTKHFVDSDNLSEVVAYAEKKLGWVVLPLYLYDHGGLTMNTSGFSCPWDSGCVGIIWATRDQINSEFGVKNKNGGYPDIKTKAYAKAQEKAAELLKSEVELYDSYLRGEVYSYSVYEYELRHDIEADAQLCVYVDCNDIESCGGFYGASEFALSEGVDAARHLTNRNIPALSAPYTVPVMAV